MCVKPFRYGLILALAAASASAAVANDEVEFVDADATRPIDISGLHVDWRGLGYRSQKDVRGIREDWNGDGIVDTLVVSATSSCAQGGCYYEIFDGKSGRSIGAPFGFPLFIHSQKIHGWPVLTMYSHISANSGWYTCMVFDGVQYVDVVGAGAKLYGRSIAALFESLDKRRRRAKTSELPPP